ncbi:transglycosylase SLT domain-containing protein [Pseudoroseomonas globiformis]|uniref:Transglycosylase SLT domain-containing protein n=1 Tax=Teichococcus globiformis TaxID=2307229 RepID=A0ABV7FYS8_9PROT
MTNHTFGFASHGAKHDSTCALMSSLRACLLPVGIVATLLLSLPVASPADAAQARQARSGPAMQKKASAASATVARKPATVRRTAHPTARRPDTRRSSAVQRREQGHHASSRSAPDVQRRNAVDTALRHAERATGLSADVLRRIAERESRLDPLAANPSSSARGLMQFTRDTWLEVVRDFGPDHGLDRYAAALTTDRDGNIGARNWRELQGILRLRDNPRLSAVLAAERLKKARPMLESSIGRAARPADLYLVHLLGPTGARRFLAALRETPGKSSVAVVGEAAKPNPGVFERSGRALPVKMVYQEVAEMFEPRLAQPDTSTLIADATQ